MPVLSWWAICAVLTRASTTLTVLSIFVVGIWLNIHGLTTVGEIVTFTSFAGMLIVRLEQAVGFANRLFHGRAAAAANSSRSPTRCRRCATGPTPSIPAACAAWSNSPTCRSPTTASAPAVADLNFTALPGETIALVGPTGAGKSTALALLHRVFDPQSGSVKIDGMDIRGLKLAALRRNIGVVFQEVLLFNRSIAENLRVGKPDATDEEMREAAARAQALDFIERNPEGFEASVGERGRMLSGGERQRISIARALLKNPPILILDEATSALDATTEMKVQAALDEVMKDRTTFVIAHRLVDRAQRHAHPGVRPRPHRRERHLRRAGPPRAARSRRWPRRSSWSPMRQPRPSDGSHAGSRPSSSCRRRTRSPKTRRNSRRTGYLIRSSTLT